MLGFDPQPHEQELVICLSKQQQNREVSTARKAISDVRPNMMLCPLFNKMMLGQCVELFRPGAGAHFRTYFSGDWDVHSISFGDHKGRPAALFRALYPQKTATVTAKSDRNLAI